MRNINKYMLTFALIALALISINACNSIIHEDLWLIKMGMSSAQVMKYVDYNSGTGVLDYNNKLIHEIKSSAIPNDAKYTVVITRKYINAQTKKIIYAFRDDKLIFWGTPLEFASHERKIINDIGIEAVKIFL